MTHTLITGIPGSGLTRTAKGIARDAIKRGETVVVVVRGDHRVAEWDDVPGTVVLTRADVVVRAVASAACGEHDIRVLDGKLAVIVDEHPGARRSTDPAAVTFIVDDVMLYDWESLESIVRVGRRAGITLVLATSRPRHLPPRIVDGMDVIDLNAAMV